MKELIKNTLILFAITLVAGALLGFVFELTKEPRAAQEAKAIKVAYKSVYQSADSFEIVNFVKNDMETVLTDKGITPKMDEISEIVSAKDKDGKIIGYVFTITAKEGYAGDIKYTVGIRNDGTVTGISFLSIRETAGLGMKAKDASFKNQFKNKKVDSFVYTKTGATERRHYGSYNYNKCSYKWG